MRKKKTEAVKITGQGIDQSFETLDDASAWLSGFTVGRAIGQPIDEVLTISGAPDKAAVATIHAPGVDSEIVFDSLTSLAKWVEGYKEAIAEVKPKRRRRRKTTRKPRAKKTTTQAPAKKKPATKKKATKKKPAKKRAAKKKPTVTKPVGHTLPVTTPVPMP